MNSFNLKLENNWNVFMPHWFLSHLLKLAFAICLGCLFILLGFSKTLLACDNMLPSQDKTVFFFYSYIQMIKWSVQARTIIWYFCILLQVIHIELFYIQPFLGWLASNYLLPLLSFSAILSVTLWCSVCLFHTTIFVLVCCLLSLSPIVLLCWNNE